MNKKAGVLLLSFFIALAACTKQPTASKKQYVSDSDGQLNWSPLSYEYLVFKSKVHIKTKDNSNHAVANVRIKKDSIIWISVTPGMGIEVLRSIVTPDSVKIINRLENKYDQYSIAYIKEKLGIPLDFYSLQNLITGDLLLPLTNEDSIFTREDRTVEITQHKADLSSISLLSLLQKKITQVSAQNNNEQSLQINYNTFARIDSNVIHQEYLALIKNDNDTILIEGVHQKIDFPTKNIAFPFSVPKKYEK